MTCHHCKSPIDDGKFYTLNVAAMKVVDEDRSTMIGNGELPVTISADLSVHDHDLQEPNGKFLVDLLDGMREANVQAETNFCSKACLIGWFADKVDGLSDFA